MAAAPCSRCFRPGIRELACASGLGHNSAESYCPTLKLSPRFPCQDQGGSFTSAKAARDGTCGAEYFSSVQAACLRGWRHGVWCTISCSPVKCVGIPMLGTRYRSSSTGHPRTSDAGLARSWRTHTASTPHIFLTYSQNNGCTGNVAATPFRVVNDTVYLPEPTNTRRVRQLSGSS